MPAASCRLLAGFALAALLLATGRAGAEPGQAAPVVIIVDSVQVVRESKAGKDIQAQIEKEMSDYSKRVSQQENDLKKTRDDLEGQRTSMAPDIFTGKMRDWQQRYETLDRNVQNKHQALQQSYQEALAKVDAVELQIIQDVAKEHKANLVLTKAAVIFEADGLDVTNEIISRLDATLPAVPVAMPKDADQPSPPAGAATKN